MKKNRCVAGLEVCVLVLRDYLKRRVMPTALVTAAPIPPIFAPKTMHWRLVAARPATSLTGPPPASEILKSRKNVAWIQARSKAFLSSVPAHCAHSFCCSFESSANESSGDVIELIEREFGGLGAGESHGFVSELRWLVCGR